MFSKYLKNLAWLWLTIPIVVVTEIVLQVWIPGNEPSAKEWSAAADFIIKRKTKDSIVVIAPKHETSAFMYLKNAVSNKDFGYFDLTNYKRVFEMSINGAKSDKTANLLLEEEEEFGNVSVCTYLNKDVAKVIYDFRDHVFEAKVLGARKKLPKFLIDTGFRQRFAISLKPKSNKDVTLTFSDVPLDGSIYGYAFIEKNNFRREVYDKDGPLEFSVFVDGQKIGQKIVNKADLMLPFNFDFSTKALSTKAQSTTSNSQVKKGTVQFKVRPKGEFKYYGFGFTADVRK